MVTVDVIRQAWQAIVEAHKADISFYSSWNAALDDGEFTYPCALWRPPTVNVRSVDTVTTEDLFTVEVWYLDQTAADRTRTERDNTYERMEAAARQVWHRFFQLYVADAGTWEGVDLDFVVETDPTLTAVWDSTGSQRTGVQFTVTLSSRAAQDCVEDYFD